MKIFVSYTTRDSIINHESLATLVEPISIFGKPFIDLIHNDSEDKQARVESELKESNILLLLRTNSIQYSKWVKWEVTTALNLGIPIKMINVENMMPTNNQLIAAIQG
ncbi:TIR domain-containing protein [Aliivibrio fischeri]|uniref:TIR domain-containing protein n=1 Tax=Aliivibrio fischeri TaxID=668 RepID=UPI00084CBA55|nr:TIR domain-containing protein [Aliivibrio fischeri]OED51070.1 hypothetical protein BEI47_10525 [Aliivibrio fischeri]